MGAPVLFTVKPIIGHQKSFEERVFTVDYQPRKIDYYDRKDSLLKTLLMTDYRLYGEKHWRAHDLFMENHQTKKNTRLT
ncbi:MAG: outer membrane lipoprotein-sorting protein, partial [Pseudomonadota bacterium]